jgi:hypothetical protein
MLKLIVLIFVPLLLVNNALAAQPYVEKPLLNKIAKKYKVFAKKRFFYLQQTLDSLHGKTDLEKLNGVNRFFNELDN